ncbi:hypothetical protein ACERII_17780 [Evansella sp. AB-rgal1]
MKTLLLGISIILFGISFILVSSGSPVTVGFFISAIGLIVSFWGWKYGA